MKQQFIITHTIRQTEIPALLDSWVNKQHLSKYFVHNKICCPYIFVYFHKTHDVLQCWSIKDLLTFFLSGVKFCIGES